MIFLIAFSSPKRFVFLNVHSQKALTEETDKVNYLEDWKMFTADLLCLNYLSSYKFDI